MLKKEYIKYKESVISIFHDYKKLTSNADVGVDIKVLKEQMNRLENTEFTSAVVDEESASKLNFDMQKILKQFKEGYEQLEVKYEKEVELLEKNKKESQYFATERERLKKEREKVESCLTQAKKWCIDEQSSLKKNIEMQKAEFTESMTASDCIDTTKETTLDGSISVEEMVNDFSKKFKQNLRETLEKSGKSFSVEHEVSTPKLHLEVFEGEMELKAWAMELKAQEIDTEQMKLELEHLDEYHKNLAAQLQKENSYEDIDKQPSINSETVEKNIGKNQKQLIEKTKNFTNVYLGFFEKEMKSVMDNIDHAIKKSHENERSNADNCNKIEELREKIKKISKEKIRIKIILSKLNLPKSVS